MNKRQEQLSYLMHSRRSELKLTQEQAAELLNISARWYQNVESGKSKPGFDLVCELAQKFNIDFSRFDEDTKNIG